MSAPLPATFLNAARTPLAAQFESGSGTILEATSAPTSKPSPAPNPVEAAIAAFNQGCYCISLDRPALLAHLKNDLGSLALPTDLFETHPHLFAPMAVFVSRQHLDTMARISAAIDEAAQLPAWRERVLEWAPPLARHTPGPRGGLLGIDFHLGPHGPQVIEVNTNPGGMLLNAALCRAQRACCGEVDLLVAGPHDAHAAGEAMWRIFTEEWQLQRGSAPLTRIAIVDDAPAQQYLYPEFLLFKALFERHGVTALIAEPGQLIHRDGALWLGDSAEHGGARIDMVYNRLTDFALGAPASRALRAAYLAGHVVLTPHPQAHALYADKRNLVLLSDAAALRSLGAREALVQTLVAGVPRTEIVSAANADRLWRTRRELFFKPAAGFGSKAAYRGDKLTRRVWDEIIAGAGDAGIDGADGVGATKVSYVAQALVRPSERVVGSTEAAQPPRTLKLDLRNYTYAGHVILTAARTWQGQTTNFRTPGGGFAPVFTETAALAETAGRVCGADCGAAAVSGASPAAVPCAVPAVVPAPVSAAAPDTAPMPSA